MPPPIVRSKPLKISASSQKVVERQLPEEVPIALVYNGSTHAVMMAAPIDLLDFALGFSLTEGIIEQVDDIETTEILEHDNGIEIRMWLSDERARAHVDRRRALVGPTGCGLCGIESLDQAIKLNTTVGEGWPVRSQDIREAVESLWPGQCLNQRTGAMHGAGFWTRDGGLEVIREDVGRHNALDKLAGALHSRGLVASSGIVVLTSRISVEMVQKAAAIGATVVAAVSAPTALAVRTADAVGITLVAVARRDSFEVFTHAHRIADIADKLDLGSHQVSHAATQIIE